MKKVVTRLLVIIAVTALVAVLTGGCTKKPVIPPESDSTASSSTSTSGSYPSAEGAYSENNLAIEGTLDDSSAAGWPAINQPGRPLWARHECAATPPCGARRCVPAP